MIRKEKGGNAVRATRKQLLGRASKGIIGLAQPEVNSRSPRHSCQYPPEFPPTGNCWMLKCSDSYRKRRNAILPLHGLYVHLAGDQRRGGLPRLSVNE